MANGGSYGSIWARLAEFAGEMGQDVKWLEYATAKSLHSALGGGTPDVWLPVKYRPDTYSGDEHPAVLLVTASEAEPILIQLDTRNNLIATAHLGSLAEGIYQERLSGADDEDRSGASRAAIPTLIFSHPRLRGEIEHRPETQHELEQLEQVRTILRGWARPHSNR